MKKTAISVRALTTPTQKRNPRANLRIESHVQQDPTERQTLTINLLPLQWVG